MRLCPWGERLHHALLVKATESFIALRSGQGLGLFQFIKFSPQTPQRTFSPVNNENDHHFTNKKKKRGSERLSKFPMFAEPVKLLFEPELCKL